MYYVTPNLLCTADDDVRGYAGKKIMKLGSRYAVLTPLMIEMIRRGNMREVSRRFSS